MSMRKSAENAGERFTEVELEFIKEYWHRGNLRLIAQVLGRTRDSLQNKVFIEGIKMNPGQAYYSYAQLKKIYDDAVRKVNNPMVHVLPQEAVHGTSEVKPVSNLKCPCLSEDTIIVKRIKLVNDGELWVCARCGRQIGCKRGNENV